MEFQPSKRSQITSTAQQFTQIANKLSDEGKRIIRLHLGQPSTAAPQGAIEAATQAINHEICGYTSSLGLDDLRKRIAKHYQEDYGVEIDYNRVIVTTGASCGFLTSCLAAFDRGDKMIVTYPIYPAYLKILEQIGVEVIGISVSKENQLQPTIEDLEAVKEDVQGLLIVSPGNPSGSIINAEELKKISAYCADRKIRILSDEIYHGIEYDPSTKADTAIRHSDDWVVINSFSKYYSMPGWRVGWVVVPPNMVSPMGNLIRNLYISAPAVSQHAALAALGCRQELDKHVVRYKENRDILLAGFPGAGFDKFLDPQGAFYFYAHVAHLHKDSHEFCLKMLNEAGIVSMPGGDFDPVHGHHYIRFSYAGATQEIKDAVEILKKFIHSHLQ